jgi:hypothetical protein
VIRIHVVGFSAILASQACIKSIKTIKVKDPSPFFGAIAHQPSLSNLKFKKSARAENSKKVFKTYCKKGNQIRKLKQNIIVILPKTPAGVLLDAAGKMSKESLEIFRVAVKRYFRIPGEDRHSRSVGVGIDIGQTSKSKLIERIKKMDNRGTPFVHMMKLPKGNMLVSQYEPDLFRIYRMGRKHIGGVVRSRGTYFPTYDYYYHSYKKSKFGESIRVPYLMTILTRQKYPIFKEDTGSCRMYIPQACKKLKIEPELEGHLKDVFVLKNSSIAEIDLLSDNYTMLIPWNVQRKIFGEKFRGRGSEIRASRETCRQARRRNRSGKSYRGMFINQCDGSILTDVAVTDRVGMWSAYIKRFTRVKESATEDPQVYKYSVTLDLDVFCSYGRNISEFVSK